MNAQKLLGLATKLDNVTEGYNQCSFLNCAAAHHFGSMGNHDNPMWQALRRQMDPMAPYHMLAREFDITFDQARMLFGGAGCGRAHTNAQRAAAFIRKFVAEEAAHVLAGTETA